MKILESFRVAGAEDEKTKKLETALTEAEGFLVEYEKEVTPQAGTYMRGDQRWRMGFGPQEMEKGAKLIEEEAKKPEVIAVKEAVDFVRKRLLPMRSGSDVSFADIGNKLKTLKNFADARLKAKLLSFEEYKLDHPEGEGEVRSLANQIKTSRENLARESDPKKNEAHNRLLAQLVANRNKHPYYWMMWEVNDLSKKVHKLGDFVSAIS